MSFGMKSKRHPYQVFTSLVPVVSYFLFNLLHFLVTFGIGGILVSSGDGRSDTILVRQVR